MTRRQVHNIAAAIVICAIITPPLVLCMTLALSGAGSLAYEVVVAAALTGIIAAIVAIITDPDIRRRP